MSEATAKSALARIKVVAELTAVYVTNNHVRPAQLPELIASFHSALGQIAQSLTVEEAVPQVELASASQIRQSITPNALISFIDGSNYQTLKRHLTKHGLTPATYRARYGLPDDYPMTAPSYSERRATLAKELGLGNFAGRGRRLEAQK